MNTFEERKSSAIIFLGIICLVLLNQILEPEHYEIYSFSNESVPLSKFDNTVGSKEYIVPNVIHLIRFGNPEFTFDEMICLLSVYRNQKPDKIIIHTNLNRFTGKYWDMVKDIPVLEKRYRKKPTHIFGKELQSVHHAADVARIEILMENGGIYLDNDVYVVKSLNKFRKFEMAFGMCGLNFHFSVSNFVLKESIGNMVLIAHKSARFLRLWYDSYHLYNGKKWYYNGGEIPLHIYRQRPDLAHLEIYSFGTNLLFEELYRMYWPEWKNHYTIHILSRHKQLSYHMDFIWRFDEDNIKHFDKTYGEMARLILFNRSDIAKDSSSIIW